MRRHGSRARGGVRAIPPRELVSVAMDHLHPFTLAHMIDSASTPTRPMPLRSLMKPARMRLRQTDKTRARSPMSFWTTSRHVTSCEVLYPASATALGRLTE